MENKTYVIGEDQELLASMLANFVAHLNNRLQVILTEMRFQEKFDTDPASLKRSRAAMLESLTSASNANAELIAWLSRAVPEPRHEALLAERLQHGPRLVRLPLALACLNDEASPARDIESSPMPPVRA